MFPSGVSKPSQIEYLPFAFFEQYRWHLDERPLKKDDEINPDVLGYIFEKYINQKQMGAYYTKEDITGYICRNTVPLSYARGVACFAGPGSVPPRSKPGSGRHPVRVGR